MWGDFLGVFDAERKNLMLNLKFVNFQKKIFAKNVPKLFLAAISFFPHQIHPKKPTCTM